MRKLPSEREFFVLKVAGEITWSELRNLGWFAVYDRPPSPHSAFTRLFVAGNLKKLQEGTERLVRTEVFVETAPSEALLTDWDRERRLWTVLQAVDAFKAQRDKDALLKIRARLESKGGSPGPKRRHFAGWKIEALRELSKGVSLVDAIKDPARKSNPESARQELWRFCQDFYGTCLVLDAHKPEDW